MISVTQPRRIAALSVSEFISRQLGTSYPGLVGYKMRFEDKTDQSTRIKVMTDGILLQEMKLDPWLSKYAVVMVDEAHERSLNIDFVLGLLKRVIAARPDFRVIISSATINTELFSSYFNNCPIVTIDTITYPVSVVYDPPAIPVSGGSLAAEDALLTKIAATTERILNNGGNGGVLIFLPGEKLIKGCAERLAGASYGRKLHILPLYGRLGKEEQERVFHSAPFGKRKVVIATNIAETSITIAGITNVIDSGLAKLNFYNPKTFTSSLVETPVSKASCNQRKGRAGRLCEGVCYRLYERKDFESRPLYTTEEIYRTDLSEVVLRMAELGITEFERFDFISPPNREGLRGAVETLNLLLALNDDNTLSRIGQLMVYFPLLPRQSRMIVEAILSCPEVLEEVIIAAAFLSAQSPYLLPPGEETDARKAHHRFRDAMGDFASYITLFRQYRESKVKDSFCKKNYLDERVMAEIENIKEQLEQIVADMGVPVLSGGGTEEYLRCVARGMIQFVCVRDGKESYRSLTADHIQIHPGSSMFRENPPFIVAGEIVRTSRMYAMSVSPLSRGLINAIDPLLEEKLLPASGKKAKGKDGRDAKAARDTKPARDGKVSREKGAPLVFHDIDGGQDGGSAWKRNTTDVVKIGSLSFTVEKVKGKKCAILPWEKLRLVLKEPGFSLSDSWLAQTGKLRGKIILDGKELLAGERLDMILRVAENLDFEVVSEKSWPKKSGFNLHENADDLLKVLPLVLRVTVAKAKSGELGFITLHTDGNGMYWFKASRGFATALNESLSSVEVLIDDTANVLTDEQKERVNGVYRKLNAFYE
jgi:HrpA-like RNA helicase